MRAPTRESTRERMISIVARGSTIIVLAVGISFLAPKAAAQSDKYPKMAPADQYLMERDAEILLARSAAPDSISSDATILVLGRQGYETAVRGKNGFVCMVERSWMAAFAYLRCRRWSDHRNHCWQVGCVTSLDHLALSQFAVKQFVLFSN